MDSQRFQGQIQSMHLVQETSDVLDLGISISYWQNLKHEEIKEQLINKDCHSQEKELFEELINLNLEYYYEFLTKYTNSQYPSYFEKCLNPLFSILQQYNFYQHFHKEIYKQSQKVQQLIEMIYGNLVKILDFVNDYIQLTQV